jgi:ligand-binding SRPBCC domain-containing protein
MYRLERELRVPRAREEVFPFFADAHNLERITPPALRFRILTPAPIEMRAGTIIDYQLRLLGFPFHWRTVIESWEPPHRFVDVQERGPYRVWRHTHSFDEVPGGTLVRDHVDYQLPLGPLGALAHWLLVKRQIAGIFAFRQRVVADLLPHA